jgi:hypothetical protein
MKKKKYFWSMIIVFIVCTVIYFLLDQFFKSSISSTAMLILRTLAIVALGAILGLLVTINVKTSVLLDIIIIISTYIVAICLEKVNSYAYLSLIQPILLFVCGLWVTRLTFKGKY